MGEIKEIEERLKHPMFLKEPGKHLQSEQTRDDIKYLLSHIKELELDLTVNASMLARQCDLAKEAETKAKELENELAKIKSDSSIGKLEVNDWGESPDY